MQLQNIFSGNTSYRTRSTVVRWSALLGIFSFSALFFSPHEARGHSHMPARHPLTGEEKVTFTVTDGNAYCCSLASIAYGEVPLRAEHAARQRFDAAHSPAPADASRHLENAQAEENFLAALIESLEPEEAGWVLARVQKAVSDRQWLRLPLDDLDFQEAQLEDNEYRQWIKALTGKIAVGKTGAELNQAAERLLPAQTTSL